MEKQRDMESKADLEPISTPKLSLFSLPNQAPEPPGMLTPPLRPPSSIPFLWEEAPGKPRTTTTTTTFARCLELPPRLLAEPKITDMLSPITVLHGPYLGRSASHSTVFARERLSSFEEMGSTSRRRQGRVSGYFGGDWARKSSKRNTRVCEDSSVISPCSSSLSNGWDSDVHTKVKFTRAGSFFPNSRSHRRIWASIYGTFKQVVPFPWKSRKIKRDGHSV